MAQKLKISVRKVLQALFTLVVATCCIVAVISASKIESNKTLSKVEVQIKSQRLYHFVEEQQIIDEAITNRNIDIMHVPVSKVDLKSMEQVLKADPWVADAQLYIDNNLVLHMLITQRIPIARLFDRTGNSYYMDKTLNTMPLSDNFKYYTSVVTNVPVLGADTQSLWLKKQIYAMVHSIQNDTFWNAQVSQIIVDSDYSFELVPVLGDQRIIFGDTSRMAEKFSNVHSFYKNVLNRIGWDKYETLDLRFKGQVVASPALPYKGPVDKGIGDLDWVKMIEATEARKDSVEASKTSGKGKPEAVANKKDVKPSGKEKEKPGASANASKPGAKPTADAHKREVKKEEKREVKKEVNKDVKDAHPAKTEVKAAQPVKKESKGEQKDKKEPIKPEQRPKEIDKKTGKYIYQEHK